jgi:predicted ATP-grasp superfamily ATP-dependent carboligase
MSRPVIATGGEWPAGLALLRGARAAGHRPIAALTRRDALSSWSRAPVARVLVPDPADSAAHASALVRLAAHHGGAIVLPGSDASLLAIAEHRDAFMAPTIVGAPPLDVVRRATDKRALGELAREAGLRTPPTREVTLADGIAGPFPAVVKPFASVAEGDSGKSERLLVSVVEDADGLRAALRGMPGARGLLQPFVKARLRTVNGVAWDGRVVCSVHKRSDRTWPPAAGVFAYGRTVEPEPALGEGCARLLGAIGWSGIFNLQFLEPQHGEPLLIDLNPRAYHSMALAIGAGANLPGVWLDLLLGRPPRPAHARPAVRFRAEDDDLRALKTLAANGHRGAALGALLPRRRTTHALFARTDPGPLAFRMRELVRSGGGSYAGAASRGR